jgi:putative tricarboxylic transport membrane protein
MKVLLLLMLVTAWVHDCRAQPYPSRPIELVSPTGPGGGSDLVARTVADIVAKEKLLPQVMVVQNRAGGGGAVGQVYVEGKRGDPYAILLAGTSSG